SEVELTVVHLPGLNTTQFTWVRARTRGRPRPVAPVYQPEIAARAIVWAAHHRRRELWVGFPTAYTIAGNRIAPWFADRYLAKTAFNGQQTEQPLDPGRPDYLEAPLDDDVDHGAHGPFGDEAKRRSPQLALAEHRRAAARAPRARRPRPTSSARAASRPPSGSGGRASLAQARERRRAAGRRARGCPSAGHRSRPRSPRRRTGPRAGRRRRCRCRCVGTPR